MYAYSLNAQEVVSPMYYQGPHSYATPFSVSCVAISVQSVVAESRPEEEENTYEH